MVSKKVRKMFIENEAKLVSRVGGLQQGVVYFGNKFNLKKLSTLKFI